MACFCFLMYGQFLFLFHVPMIFQWPQLFRPHLFFTVLDCANYCHLNFGDGIWKFKFLEVLFSPIVSYEISSIAYGLTMIIIACITIVSLYLFYRILFIYEIRIDNSLSREIVIFLGMAILLVGACYPQVFYWFDGFHYAWFMVFTLWE